MKKAYIMAAITIFCWSTMAPVSKLLLADLSNMEVLYYGSAIAAIVLFLAILQQKQLPLLFCHTGTDFLQLFGIGVIGYFFYSAFYYQGLSILPSQIACILNYLWPVLTVCFSCILLREPLSPARILALLLSFAGVILIFSGSGQNTASAYHSVRGYICCILAACLYALFNVLNKKKGGNQLINMFFYIATGAVLAFFCCLPTGFSPLTVPQILGLLWLGIFINAVGFLLWAMALQHSNSATIANFAYLTPAISIVFSHILLDEPVLVSAIAGLALILGGFFLQLFFSDPR
ncbi:MAG: DMT family transporter [Peptococcaceae bacterium]